MAAAPAPLRIFAAPNNHPYRVFAYPFTLLERTKFLLFVKPLIRTPLVEIYKNEQIIKRL
jgi:hypothetical protein